MQAITPLVPWGDSELLSAGGAESVVGFEVCYSENFPSRAGVGSGNTRVNANGSPATRSVEFLVGAFPVSLRALSVPFTCPGTQRLRVGPGVSHLQSFPLAAGGSSVFQRRVASPAQ